MWDLQPRSVFYFQHGLAPRAGSLETYDGKTFDPTISSENRRSDYSPGRPRGVGWKEGDDRRNNGESTEGSRSASGSPCHGSWYHLHIDLDDLVAKECQARANNDGVSVLWIAGL